MTVSAKDGARLMGVTLICACAAFICFLFLTYLTELVAIEGKILPGPMQIIYDAQVATSKVVIAVSGGALISTAIVVLLFYTGQYIDVHSKELGILKALGWTNAEISRGFFIFGLSALVGCACGVFIGYLALPSFLDSMNEDHLLPEISPVLHGELLVYLVVLPSAAFALAAVLFGAHRLKRPAVALMKGLPAPEKKTRPVRDSDAPFLTSMRRSIVRTSRSLAFFVFIGAFCFSCMLQMSTSMSDLSSEWMGIMMLVIGIVLALTCLYLSVSSAVRRCTPAAAIMHACGYSAAECRNALLGGFRPFAYLGFAVGTVYQYVLLRLILDHFFADFPEALEYSFDTPVMFLCLVLFVVLYEGGALLSSRRLMTVQMRELTSE